jgi:hypothetical protein
MKVAKTSAVLLFIAGVTSITSSNAQHRERHEREWHGDIRVFHRHDLPRWRAGRWIHGRHAGRLAWWWVVDGVWYAYPAPVYPYPDPYVPPVVVTPPPAVVQAPSAVPPAQPGNWYYCDSARAYYPYVSECPSGWRSVPATPPPG